jgi:hypothetical protein
MRRLLLAREGSRRSEGCRYIDQDGFRETLANLIRRKALYAPAAELRDTILALKQLPEENQRAIADIANVRPYTVVSSKENVLLNEAKIRDHRRLDHAETIR